MALSFVNKGQRSNNQNLPLPHSQPEAAAAALGVPEFYGAAKSRVSARQPRTDDSMGNGPSRSTANPNPNPPFASARGGTGTGTAAASAAGPSLRVPSQDKNKAASSSSRRGGPAPSAASSTSVINLDDDSQTPDRSQSLSQTTNAAPVAAPPPRLRPSGVSTRAQKRLQLSAGLEDGDSEPGWYLDGVTVTHGDVKRLEPCEFLNDTLIDFFLKFIDRYVREWAGASWTLRAWAQCRRFMVERS